MMSPAVVDRQPRQNAASAQDAEIGEQTPLLPGLQSASSSEPLPLKEMKAESLKEKAVAAAAAVSFITSILAILLQGPMHPVVLVSGILGLVVAPAAAIQQQKLTQTEALQQTNERMDLEVDQLAMENKRLASQVQEMEETVLNLQTMEETLDTLQRFEGQSVAELEKQLRESQAILDQMETNVKSQVLQNLIQIMLAIDNDDGVLSDTEMESLIHKIETIQGIELKEDKLRQTILRKGRSIFSVIEVARHLVTEDVPPEQNIFAYIEQESKPQK